MKIIIIAPYFYPKTGGLENYAYNIAKGLAKDNEVVIVTSNHLAKKKKIESFDGLKVIRLPYWFKLSNTPINPKWYFDLKKIFKNEKPDIINAHTPVPFISDIAARVKGRVPFVLTYHNDLIKDNWLNSICKLYYSLIGNTTLSLSKKIISTSNYYVSISPYLKKYKNKIEIVPPGVNFSEFNLKVKKGFLRTKFNLKKDKLVLFVGQLDKTHLHKGLNYLIKAISLINDKSTKLIIVGKGDHVNEYKKTAKKWGVSHRVLFLGFVPDQNLPKVYRDVDVTVLPTYNKSEGFGMVLHESLACGTPVIGTKVGGIPAALENGKLGVLVEPKNVKMLAKAIEGRYIHSKLPKVYDWDRLVKRTGVVFKCQR